ncbi:MAG: hypothetical protein Q4A32_03970 [Lachnospiraceae bacterium]|nr:hypothetical protein [Lachnospiraceae bacterium]
MIVQKTSIFPASRETVFRKLQQLETLQYIAKPFASFEPVGEEMKVWAVGSTSSYRFKLFDFMPHFDALYKMMPSWDKIRSNYGK